MIKASSSLQDLRRRLYVKAKAEPSWCFWGLYVHVCKRETLWEAYLPVASTSLGIERPVIVARNDAIAASSARHGTPLR